jgi:hypothetical protein
MEKKFLSDISNSIELIESFTKDLNSFAEYQKDLKTKEERFPNYKLEKQINSFL